MLTGLAYGRLGDPRSAAAKFADAKALADDDRALLNELAYLRGQLAWISRKLDVAEREISRAPHCSYARSVTLAANAFNEVSHERPVFRPRDFGRGFVACSQQSQSPIISGLHCLSISYVPFVKLVSPQPGSSGVPTGEQTLVFESFGATPSATPVAITLLTGSSAPIAAASTAVPSPLPSGAATPVPGPNPSATPSLFAVSADLQSAGTYTVIARVDLAGCETGTTELSVGSFGAF